MVETEIICTLEPNGRVYIIERVPLRVCQETGEQSFPPETVDQVQALITRGAKPARVIETRVYEYT